MNAATFVALPLIGGASPAGMRAHTVAALRGNRLIGVDFSGAERLPFDFAIALALCELRRRSGSLVPCLLSSSLLGAAALFYRG